MTARSMKGRLLTTRQLRTLPSTVTTQRTSIIPSTSRSSAFSVYLGLGPEMNRDTVANVQAAGFIVEKVRNVYLDVVKVIHARKPATA